ncbi:HNH endonuclease [Bradyrhizobium pachyrhizi]|uniref:HNH endonuclease n=1 Tax=Bradyrhizobium pachyrhizi TaxID=280333 RepID=UPI003D367C9A
MASSRTITVLERFGVYAVWEGRCFWCRSPIAFAQCHVDHVIPVSTPESIDSIRREYSLPSTFEIDSFENWVPSCQACNLRKGNMRLPPSPAMVMHLQSAQERAPKAKAVADDLARERSAAPLLARIERGLATGIVSQAEVQRLFSHVPPPSEAFKMSDEWAVQQAHSQVQVVYLSPLYFPEGRKKFRAERQQQIDVLTLQSAQLAAEIAKLTPIDVQEREQLLQRKASVDHSLAKLKQGGLGYTGR